MRRGHALALAMMRSPSSPKNLFTSLGPGGSVVRRLLPAAAAILVALAFLRYQGEQHGLYGTKVGILLITVAAIGLIGGLLWYFAD